MPLEDRLAQITRCMDEINAIAIFMPSAPTRWDLEYAWVGYMDWLYELHILLHEV